jgi:hypothetical protein
MFELLIKHCRTIKKKLILIIDNYNKIDSLMNSKKEAKQDFATELNGVFRGLECGLTIILASCNNETQQDTRKIILAKNIYYDDLTLSLKGIRQYAQFIRTNFINISFFLIVLQCLINNSNIF